MVNINKENAQDFLKKHPYLFDNKKGRKNVYTLVFVLGLMLGGIGYLIDNNRFLVAVAIILVSVTVIALVLMRTKFKKLKFARDIYDMIFGMFLVLFLNFSLYLTLDHHFGKKSWLPIVTVLGSVAVILITSVLSTTYMLRKIMLGRYSGEITQSGGSGCAVIPGTAGILFVRVF